MENNSCLNSSPPKSPSLLSSLRNFRYQPQSKPILSMNSELKNTSTSSCSDICETNSPWRFEFPTENASMCFSTQPVVPNPLNLNDMKRKLNSEMEKILTPTKREKVDTNGSSSPSKASFVTLEKNIEYVQNLFPKTDRMQIQDALVAANLSVDKAAEKIRVAMLKNAVPTGMKDISTQSKVWKRIKPFPETSSATTNGSNLNVSPQAKKVRCESEEENSDGDYYYFSKTKRDKILAFLSKARMPELLSVSSCSQKKAEIILEMQPFKNWKQLNEKFSGNGINPTSFFDNVVETLRLQSEISILMKNCTELSSAMTNKLSKLSEYREANLMSLGQQPKSLSPELKLATYQMIGLGWLRLLHEQGVNGILADEMGLGKTVQVIAFLAYLKEQKLQRAVHLIVVPSSTLENWSNELKRWCPTLNVEMYYGSQEERRHLRFWWRDVKNKAEVDNVNVLVTTYNLVNSTPEDRVFFRKMHLQYIIYDEAHMLKNMGTQRYSSLMKVDAEHRILLTGTPLQNNLVELMSLLVFVMPNMFAHKQEDLKKLFKTSPKGSSDDETSEYAREKINQAKKIMEPFIMRRLKSDVLQDLPSKSEEVVLCKMTEAQTELYSQVINGLKDGTDDLENVADVNSENGVQECEEEIEKSGLSGSMAIMMRLRRAANHPALIRNQFSDTIISNIAKKLKADRTYKEDNYEKILDGLYEMSDHQIHQLSCEYKSIAEYKLTQEYLLSSGKFQKLDELLPTLQSKGHRVLIFSQFRQVIDILEDYCTIRKYKCLRLDGQTPVVERQTLIDEFNQDDSILIFLLTTRAGGFGINLVSADTVIIHDIDLNPYNDKQAEDRCHRVGQVRPVNVMRFISTNTIEQSMLKIAQCKLSLEQQISQGRNSKESEKKLMQLLKEELKTHY